MVKPLPTLPFSLLLLILGKTSKERRKNNYEISASIKILRFYKKTQQEE